VADPAQHLIGAGKFFPPFANRFAPSAPLYVKARKRWKELSVMHQRLTGAWEEVFR
jgi:hypothetical protein